MQAECVATTDLPQWHHNVTPMFFTSNPTNQEYLGKNTDSDCLSWLRLMRPIPGDLLA
jgi:hypothetical protein